MVVSHSTLPIMPSLYLVWCFVDVCLYLKARNRLTQLYLSYHRTLEVAALVRGFLTPEEQHKPVPEFTLGVPMRICCASWVVHVDSYAAGSGISL